MFRPLALVVSAMLVIGVSCGGGGSSSPELKAGRDIYADRCSTCHGSSGQGGVGPALDEVLTTWPTCADHKRWVSLGSEGWSIDVGPTYGATNKEIKAVMPAFGEVLTEREIALVAAYERAEYGGGDEAAVLADCGLTSP